MIETDPQAEEPTGWNSRRYLMGRAQISMIRRKNTAATIRRNIPVDRLPAEQFPCPMAFAYGEILASAPQYQASWPRIKPKREKWE